jgi:hypothetical protein
MHPEIEHLHEAGVHGQFFAQKKEGLREFPSFLYHNHICNNLQYLDYFFLFLKCPINIIGTTTIAAKRINIIGSSFIDEKAATLEFVVSELFGASIIRLQNITPKITRYTIFLYLLILFLFVFFFIISPIFKVNFILINYYLTFLTLMC